MRPGSVKWSFRCAERRAPSEGAQVAQRLAGRADKVAEAVEALEWESEG